KPAHMADRSTPIGWYACGPRTVNGQSCYGATNQQQCPAGSYGSTSGAYQCTTCPAGSFCQSSGQTTAQKCSPGYFSGSTGATSCTPCQPGTFNNAFVVVEQGATRCCRCCAGTYQDQTSQTHCLSCYEHTNPHRSYSPVGSSNVNQCQASPISGVTNNPSCANTSNNNVNGHDYCPPEQGNNVPNANPSALNRRRTHIHCPKPMIQCSVLLGRGGKECINSLTNAESCGGCVSPDDPYATGKDCTMIENSNRVNCVHGRCVIESCRKGYSVSKNGKSCVHKKSSGGSDTAHAESVARAIKKRTNHRAL
ncbi:hypothetical protein FRB90_005101, partial [Tulasnella sp. 427]